MSSPSAPVWTQNGWMPSGETLLRWRVPAAAAGLGLASVAVMAAATATKSHNFWVFAVLGGAHRGRGHHRPGGADGRAPGPVPHGCAASSQLRGGDGRAVRHPGAGRVQPDPRPRLPRHRTLHHRHPRSRPAHPTSLALRSASLPAGASPSGCRRSSGSALAGSPSGPWSASLPAGASPSGCRRSSGSRPGGLASFCPSWVSGSGSRRALRPLRRQPSVSPAGLGRPPSWPFGRQASLRAFAIGVVGPAARPWRARLLALRSASLPAGLRHLGVVSRSSGEPACVSRRSGPVRRGGPPRAGCRCTTRACDRGANATAGPSGGIGRSAPVRR